MKPRGERGSALRVRRPPAKAGLFRRAFAAVTATRPMLFVSRHVGWKIDPWLLRVSRGRIRSTLVVPSAVLESRGARTGATRRNAVIYFHDDDRVVIVPSNAGAPGDPAWYHNVVAHPDVTLGGVPMRATVIDDVDRDRVWALADRVYPAFATFRRKAAKAGRTIPLIHLAEITAD